MMRGMSTPGRTDPADAPRLARALDQLRSAVEENTARNIELLRRIDAMRAVVGGSPAELLAADQRPRAVELLTKNVDALHTAGATFRAVFAQTLYEGGMTIAAIADDFGVTRQRVSALLKQRHASVDI